MVQDYDLVVIGSTFVGIGATLSQNENVLMVDCRPTLGTEFISCYNSGKNFDTDNMCLPTKILYNELMRHMILKDGVLRIASVDPIVYNYFKDLDISFLLQTDVTSLKQIADRLELDLYNAEGF